MFLLWNCNCIRHLSVLQMNTLHILLVLFVWFYDDQLAHVRGKTALNGITIALNYVVL